jgi:hypothetical protein
MSEGKDFYRAHYPPDAPLFHLPWWLDAVCGNEWQAAVINEEEELKAYYLYAQKGSRPGSPVYMPHLTQFLGPGYRLTETGVRQRNNEETEILEHLLAQLPAFGSFESRWNHRYQNWLPFHWQHFQQRTRYTYVLPDIADPVQLQENFSEKIRREISKAQKRFTAERSQDCTALLLLLQKSFREKNMKLPFEHNVLTRAFSAAAANDAGAVLLANEASGKTAASIFVAWDANTAYYIIGARDEAFGNSGAMSFLFLTAFSQLQHRVKAFDFEGSMIKGVENYFRSFGAEQKGFFEITKINSPLLKMKSTVKSLLRK